MRVRAVVVVACVGLVCGLRPLASREPTFAARLETLRTQSNLPAVAGATFSSAEVSAVSAIGVRKMGDTTPVTPDDLWHIGSITKSFTSLLTAKFVERGEMSWTSTLGDLLGPRAGKFAPVTLAQLLSHRAGLPANVLPGMMASVAQGAPTVDVQRQRVIDAALATDPTAAPGAAYLYSNLGYIIAGAILEAKAKKPWEDLVRDEVLSPLGLASAGHGPPGVPNLLTQPRGHRRATSGTLTPVEPGVGADNPPYLGPAGRLHMTVGDLARWGQAHLRGERGQDGIVKVDTFKRLHQPDAGATYAMGWVSQATPDRRVIWHNGSNTFWYAIVAFDAAADRGVVIMTNGSIGAAQAVDAAAMAAIRAPSS
ncbi:MAG TPA: serine hydrolase domain-containing protein [Vicinamibacterales bacterium]|nr:serine hydrolase domain-containing protein [Vicinamibacterales bacterium]